MISHSGTPEVVVAIIDTGMDLTHPDLKASLWVNSGEIPNNGIDDDGNGENVWERWVAGAQLKGHISDIFIWTAALPQASFLIFESGPHTYSGFIDDIHGWDFAGACLGGQGGSSSSCPGGCGQRATPLDDDGHGTHIAGIVAAAQV